MQLFFQKNISGTSFDLDSRESKHLIKVLRKSVGDLVHFTNGKGALYTCKIEELQLKKTKLSILGQEFQPRDDYYIHLAIAPTKSQDRMEWMVEKITEIGIHEISLLNTDNTERNYLKIDRMEKKIISACKQSLKTWKPKINEPRDFTDFIADPAFSTFQKFIAYVDPANQSHLMGQAAINGSYLIMIGPEGDFSPNEIQKGFEQNFKACSLGKSRLRTETAGLVAVHTLNLINL
ncbi:MAG: 16S rRNA (uracil(1498)-N(3))-methyltransferase [Anditalea sp.]